MRFSSSSGVFAASVLLLQNLASACNPMTESGCTPDKALGTTVNVDFTKGPSSEFTANYNEISYESDGIHLTVGAKGDAPLLVSNWYIMFGRFEIIFKSAPGVGMITSAILQSDDLDEIDWELLGATPNEAQTNYFGRGVTETYDREVTVADPTAVTGFNKYVIDWNQERIIWSINDTPLRTQYAANADIDSSGKSEYPQSPMQVKIGPWAGGDPDNSAGTISWAGGEIVYGNGPYTMVVQSVSVTDYSTGSEYSYNSGFSGTYEGISAVGGAVLGNAAGNTAPASTPASVVSSTPSTTPISSATVATSTVVAGYTSTTSSTETYPTTASSSSVDTRTGYPWVPRSSSTLGASSPAVTSTTTTMSYTSGSSSSSVIASSSASPLSSSSAASTSPSSFSPPVAPSSTSSAVASTAASSQTSTAVIASTSSIVTTIAPSTTSVSAQSDVATSTASAITSAYTGGSARSAAAKLGAAACVAAGLVMIV